MTQHSITRDIPADEAAALARALEKDGYCVIRSYVLPEKLTGLNADMETCFSQFSANFGKDGYVAPVGIQSVIREDRVVNNVFHFHRQVLEMATAGRHLEVVKPFLNDPFYGLIPKEDPNFILAQLNAREGRVALPFHVDTRMCTAGPSTWSLQGYLSLGPTHAGNGGLRVVPGSHASGVFPDYTKDYPEAVNLALDPGDLVLFSSQLHHATTACAEGQAPAWTILFTYRCWWVKQQYDIAAMVPKEWWTGLTPNQKLVLGACSQVNADIYGAASSRKGYDGL